MALSFCLKTKIDTQNDIFVVSRNVDAMKIDSNPRNDEHDNSLVDDVTLDDASGDNKSDAENILNDETRLDDTSISVVSGNNDKSAKKNKPGKSRKSTSNDNKNNKTYVELTQEAIITLKDRTGSSLPAIKKWILTQNPDLSGPQFNIRVNQALKKGVTQKRFEKVKGSFKLSSSFREAERVKKRKKIAALSKLKRDAELKEIQAKKKVIEEAKKREEKMHISEAEQERLDKEKKAREEAAKRKAAEEARAKLIADKIRKRKYPLEDSKLHAEDKELGVKTPPEVSARPYLPFFWQMTLPLSDKSRLGKTSSLVLNASKVESLDFGSRGLVPDLLQVYHFFKGDVNFMISRDGSPLVADFTLKHLVHATEQIINGNARRTKLLPPLLVHLFVTSLQILWQLPALNTDDSITDLSIHEFQLRKDFNNYLLPYLTPVSWADLCYMYMDAMERYCSSDLSKNENVLQPVPIDPAYLLGVKDEIVVPETPSLKNITSKLDQSEVPIAEDDNQDQNPITFDSRPDGYFGYLGDPQGVLYRACDKLGKQDPWNLTAEDLMALLRALTDDILGSHPAASVDIADREDQMNELLKAKRIADNSFRKIRLAFEGPKKPVRKMPASDKNDETAITVNGGVETSKGATVKAECLDIENDSAAVFVPTASKKQFEIATKNQEKANEAYEKGIRKLVARTQPVGFDRNFNAIYFFRSDPDILYVEDRKSPSGAFSYFPLDTQLPRFSWHIIETTSLFESYTGSLDIRGKREHDLYEALLGPQGSQQSLRRFLYDDLKEQQKARAMLKEKEALSERLQAAMIKCDEEKGRRSGRLAGHAESELAVIQHEIHCLENGVIETIDKDRSNHAQLLGLEAVKRFEKGGRVETRKSRERKSLAKTRDLPVIHCSKLCGTGNIDGSGAVGIIVADLLELEEFCESLVPWKKGLSARQAWINKVEESVHAWNTISYDLQAESDDRGNDQASTKRQKVDGASASTRSVSSIIALLKQPLLELEARVADITNLASVADDERVADENMSSDGSENDQANQERLEKVWKKCVHRIRETPSKSYFLIREHLVAALAAARKAHLPDVVAGLRAALLLFHPNAAGACKAASIRVLEAHGDYDGDDDSMDEYDEQEDSNEDVPISVICAEAVIISSCLGGSSEASRSDWIACVKASKTLSRLATLTAAFTREGTEELKMLETQRDLLKESITQWENQGERNKKKGVTGKISNEPSEVWANVELTEEFCMAKVEESLWWPAKKCKIREMGIENSLGKLDRCIVALIGKKAGLRVVRTTDVMPFTDDQIESHVDIVEYSKEIRLLLDDSIRTARRILRGYDKRKKK